MRIISSRFPRHAAASCNMPASKKRKPAAGGRGRGRGQGQGRGQGRRGTRTGRAGRASAADPAPLPAPNLQHPDEDSSDWSDSDDDMSLQALRAKTAKTAETACPGATAERFSFGRSPPQAGAAIVRVEESASPRRLSFMSSPAAAVGSPAFAASSPATQREFDFAPSPGAAARAPSGGWVCAPDGGLVPVADGRRFNSGTIGAGSRNNRRNSAKQALVQAVHRAAVDTSKITAADVREATNRRRRTGTDDQPAARATVEFARIRTRDPHLGPPKGTYLRAMQLNLTWANHRMAGRN